MKEIVFHPERLGSAQKKTTKQHPRQQQPIAQYYQLKSKGAECVFHKAGDQAVLFGNRPDQKKVHAYLLDFSTPAPHKLWCFDKDRDVIAKPPEHAQLIQCFTDRLRIYDDAGKTFDIEAPVIYVYRRGDELFVATANCTRSEMKEKAKKEREAAMGIWRAD
ncbi:MAG: hypothetical protein MR218_08455 [Eubacterium sp.]|nr:hypothetical protein [Eubacterium sp.]